MASSSSTSPLASAFSSQLWKYHVFLSFRGEDTRKTFVDHLYTTLVQQGILTYKDDETLPRGKSIGLSLMRAIEESQIAIIVFSRNYADSSWCLDELAHIMKCKESRNQIVMPVFYDVEPSEVRKQNLKYGEAFVKHEVENTKKVESWRKALVDASNISGWETKYIANGHESKCIQTIVDTISNMLRPITSSLDDNLVGVEVRMKALISKLQVGFGGKRMIGIWGVGGGGKTTLASCVYDEISCKFDGCCFLKNVRESIKKDGLEKLQEKILCGVLKQKQLEVGRVEEGRHMIKDRLQHRKVLIVLDDVDNIEHLEQLAGSRDWFGEESRIIITTRDEHVLTAHKVDVIYSISLLNNDEAMNLFFKHAPRGGRRTEDYEKLSKDVVSYAGGLPLALRVLGRFLCDKETIEWRSALARLKEIPEANILEKLKISFDGLTPLERELFLDIACFFRGQFKSEWIMLILDACGFHPVIGIKVLVQKALVTISEYGAFDMHDLVQEMAHYIVRGKHPKNPENHSRVWEEQDVQKIYAIDEKKNLDRIEAISFWCERRDESQRALQIAANMKKLRWIDLQFHDLWDKTTPPLTIVPDKSFPPRELCCLKFYGLNAKQLWVGYKYLPNLRMIILYYLKSLIKTPDFDGLPNLQTFIVEGSQLLKEIDPSFGRLEKLVFVEIRDCDNLEMLPPISRSMKLENFQISRCKSVFNLSKIQQSTENVVPRNMNHIGLWFFSGCLRKLNLADCNLADGDIRSDVVWEIPNLQELNLSQNRFVQLNFGLLRLPRLKCLNVSFCMDLVELLELPSSIAVLIADSCWSLESLGDISNCKWLWKVSLRTYYNKLGPIGDLLLDSMIQGNAKDYFLCLNVTDIDIWRGLSVLWVDWVKTYNAQLPPNWYNDSSGILMFVRSGYSDNIDSINISIKQRLDEDVESELAQEESDDETIDTYHDYTYVGYVSFSSLRRTGCFNSTYKFISFSTKYRYLYGRLRVVLLPKDDQLQKTQVTTDDPSEFWDEKEDFDRKTFEIQHDSNSSSVEILWKPLSLSHYGG